MTMAMERMGTDGSCLQTTSTLPPQLQQREKPSVQKGVALSAFRPKYLNLILEATPRRETQCTFWCSSVPQY